MMQEQEVRAYLADRYNSDIVKTGVEASPSVAGLYFGEDDAWLVYGKMPNTDDDGWVFAGHTCDILRDIRVCC